MQQKQNSGELTPAPGMCDLGRFYLSCLDFFVYSVPNTVILEYVLRQTIDTTNTGCNI